MNKITVKIDGIEVDGELISAAPHRFTGEPLFYVRAVKPGNKQASCDWYGENFVKHYQGKFYTERKANERGR